MTAELSERTIINSPNLRISNDIPDAEKLTDEESRFESYIINTETVSRLGGFALADGEKTIFAIDSNGLAETKTVSYSRRTQSYDRGLSDEELQAAIRSKLEAKATPGVKPQGRLGELNPQFNRRPRSL